MVDAGWGEGDRNGRERSKVRLTKLEGVHPLIYGLFGLVPIQFCKF